MKFAHEQILLSFNLNFFREGIDISQSKSNNRNNPLSANKNCSNSLYLTTKLNTYKTTSNQIEHDRDQIILASLTTTTTTTTTTITISLLTC